MTALVCMIKEGHRKSIQLRATPQGAEKFCQQLAQMACILRLCLVKNSISLETARLQKDAPYKIKVKFKISSLWVGLGLFLFVCFLRYCMEERRKRNIENFKNHFLQFIVHYHHGSMNSFLLFIKIFSPLGSNATPIPPPPSHSNVFDKRS